MRDNCNVPCDLRNWREVSTPKFKKDYPGKHVRVISDPHYRRFKGMAFTFPPEGVLYVESRQAYESHYYLRCNWSCPCCGHGHYRDIEESWIAQGNIVFVEDTLEANPEADGLIYLGSPYSHPDPSVRQFRFLAVSQAAAVLMASMPGMHVFAPICMGHPIAVCGQAVGIAGDFSQWAEFDRYMLEKATHFVALKLDGWEESVGLKAEWEHAKRCGRAIYSMDADNVLTPNPHLNFKVEDL